MKKPSSIIVIKEGLRMMKRAKRVRNKGFASYNGNAKEICRAIIDDAYDKENKYFRVSGANGHFCEFYMRDFGLCCESLVKLGYEKEVRLTLEYAMKIYKKNNKITTAINPEKMPFNYFLPAGPDALAFLLYSITHTSNQDIVLKSAQNKEFVQEQINYFAKRFIDERTLLPKKNLHVSSIRDQSKRNASCYDAIMIAIVAREAKPLKLKFMYKFEDVKNAIIKNYWNGIYFFQDLNKQDIVVADANIFPFWSKVIEDKKMLEQAMDAISASGIDSPFPIKYVSSLDKSREKTSFHIANIFSSDYETDSIWMHLGLAYLQVLKKYDLSKAKHHLETYTDNIMEYKTFLEVYDTNGKPFIRQFYATDEAILWCANYLVLENEIK